MKRRALAFLLLLAFTACTAPRSRSFVVVQNGLEVTVTLHRSPQHQNLRLVTVEVRDSDLHQAIVNAEVGVEATGKAVLRAANNGNGRYEAALNEPPGSSADIGIAVVAGEKRAAFRLQRP